MIERETDAAGRIVYSSSDPREIMVLAGRVFGIPRLTEEERAREREAWRGVDELATREIAREGGFWG